MLIAILKIDFNVLKCREKHKVYAKMLFHYLNVNSHTPLLSNRVKLEKRQLRNLRDPQFCCFAG